MLYCRTWLSLLWSDISDRGIDICWTSCRRFVIVADQCYIGDITLMWSFVNYGNNCVRLEVSSIFIIYISICSEIWLSVINFATNAFLIIINDIFIILSISVSASVTIITLISYFSSRCPWTSVICISMSKKKVALNQ